MWNNIKEYILAFLKSRLLVVALLVVFLFAVIIQKLFSLQIVHGDEYVNNFEMQIRKERTLAGARGKIYDRNGELLAYNELAYSITMTDNGNYNSVKEKNEQLNGQIEHLIRIIEQHGDALVQDFELVLNERGELAFSVEGNSLKRFLGDVYEKSVSKLTKEQLLSTPDAAFLELCKKYGLESEDYSIADKLKILRIRMDMTQNNYQKYITTTVAEDVSQETVALVMENSEEIQGVGVEEVTMRRYVDSQYFAHIIGYTGRISVEELEKLNEEEEFYDSNDMVGKTGIEQYMEKQLQGKKGSEVLYVNNVGKILEVAEHKDPSIGNDVYLTIDKELQKSVYNLIEQKLAGILISKIRNVKTYTPTANSKADDIIIPIDDVYFALFNNNVIDIDRMKDPAASDVEQSVYAIYQAKHNTVTSMVMDELNASAPTPQEGLSDEMKSYTSRIADILSDEGILVTDKIDKGNEVYQNWKKEKNSLEEYLREAIAKNWIDVTKISAEGEYTNSDETYQAVLSYIESAIQNDDKLNKSMFKYLIADNQISGRQVALLLYAQGALAPDEGNESALRDGRVGAYDFMLSKINNLEITPAQLALDPCSGSCTVTDPNTGEVLAMVSYPGYDNNRLANSVDANYYAELINDLSKPLYNHATQERSAPGSTFKMVTAVAGLSEGVITPSTCITDKVEFKEISPSPKCWSRAGHGSVNVSQALEHSCNYFFYQVGYDLSKTNGNYDIAAGINTLRKYASMFGLNQKSGVEITESQPSLASTDSVRAAIGQNNHNLASVQLARYVTAIANSGTVYNLSLLDKVVDESGTVIADYSPQVLNQVKLPDSTWNAVHTGMNLVAKHNDVLKRLSIETAGKTGTAQENALRPNHALFVGYAPYDAPQIALSVKIANGYTSANAAEIASEVFTYYFKLAGYEQLLSRTASRPTSSSIED